MRSSLYRGRSPHFGWHVDADCLKRTAPASGLVRLFVYLITPILGSTILFMVGCSGISSGAKNSSSSQVPEYPIPSPGPTGMFFGMNTNQLGDAFPGTMIPLTSWRTLGSDVKMGRH
jgi:hypothetical protein